MSDASEDQAARYRTIRFGGSVGVRRSISVSKVDLLLFDRINVMGLERQIAAPATGSQMAAEAVYLAEQGFLDDAPETVGQLGALIPDAYEMPAQSSKFEWLYRLGSGARHPIVGDLWGERLPVGGELIVSWTFNVAFGERTMPVLEGLPTEADWQWLDTALIIPEELRSRGPSTSLLEIVIPELPIPGDDVGLADLLDFSRDPETVRRRNRLFLAVRRAEIESQSAEAFSVSLAEALADYEDHMRLANLRAKTSAARLVLAATLGVVEELVHLRPLKALDAVFEYRTLKADRLEAELTSPGHEFALIHDARQRFG